MLTRKIVGQVIALSLLACVAQLAAASWDLGAAWREYKQAVETRDVERTVVAAREVLQIAERDIPASDERLAIVTHNYGKALLSARQQDEAAQALELALQRYEAIHGDDSDALLPVIQDLADAYADRSGPNLQAKHYKRAIKLADAHYGDTSVRYADVLLRAGKHMFQGSRSGGGKQYLQDAYDIYVADQGNGSLKAGEAAYFLGKLEFSRQNFRNAEARLLDALGIYDIETQVGHQRQLLTRALLVQTYENLGDSWRATEHCVAIGQMNMMSPDQDTQPIFRLAPDYPIDMLSSRKEGFVDVGFTVDEMGFVQDPVILRRTGGRSFERAALEAVERFRYAPKFVDGQAVTTENVRTRITFKIN